MSSDTIKINILQETIGLNPEYAISYRELGNVCYYRKNYDDASANYKKSMSLDSTFTGLYYNLALAYDESGQTEDAYIYYKKYISLNPGINDNYVQFSKLRIMEMESYSF